MTLEREQRAIPAAFQTSQAGERKGADHRGRPGQGIDARELGLFPAAWLPR